ncbi:MAG: 16S rRNA (cytosine(1402)-N(4))-methyltransferase RsmH [Tepidisphaerales bacterium]
MQKLIRHIPVLMDAVLDSLRPAPGHVVVDCTVGLGGHAAELLGRIMPGGRLIGLDFDAGNLELARTKLAAVSSDFELHHGNFAGLPNILAAGGIDKVDAVLADVGVASPHIDDPARGFSYRHNGPLDMRMDQTRGQSAAALVNTMPPDRLAEALRTLGDEEDADEIARCIAERRAEKPIETTHDLMAIVCQARDFTLKRAAGAKLHPAARTFQVLRMLVNRELPNLQRLLDVLPDVLRPGAAAAIISFHSGEDRLVKKAFKIALDQGIYSDISFEPAIADEREQRANPRSRSAKLRWARRA